MTNSRILSGLVLLGFCLLSYTFSAPSAVWAQQETPDSPPEVQKETTNTPPGAQTDPPQGEPTETPAGQPQTANNNNAATDAAATPESLPELRKQWSELDKKLNDKKLEFEATKEPQPQALRRQEYLALIDQANDLIDRMKSAALESLQADPTNSDTLRLLMGILMNDAQQDRAGEVMRIGQILISKDLNPKYFQTAVESNRLSLSAKDMFEELLIRQRESQADDLPQVKLETSKGDIVIELFENQAPNTTANFISLVEKSFYDGVAFHRVMDQFMAQTGDPEGTGAGGPGYEIACECYTPEARRHYAGAVSMAHAGRDTGGSQFFLTFDRTEGVKNLDGKHTVFGRVISGFEVLSALNRTHRMESLQEVKIPDIEPDKISRAVVIRKRDHEYQVKKIGDQDASDAGTPTDNQPPAQPGGDQPATTDSDGGNKTK